MRSFLSPLVQLRENAPCGHPWECVCPECEFYGHSYVSEWWYQFQREGGIYGRFDLVAGSATGFAKVKPGLIDDFKEFLTPG